jgi:hypothetical protein
MCRTFAALIFCASVSARLVSAQDAGNSPKPAAPCSPDAKAAEDIATATKQALACEWIDPQAVQHTLKALQFYTTPTRKKDRCTPADPKKKEDPEQFLSVNEAAKEALCELIAGAPADKDLYTAAQGDSENPGRSDFLDSLARANTLKLKAPADEDDLFGKAQKLIGEIYFSAGGKLALVKIHSSFVGANNYLALFRLLNAYPIDADKKKYAGNLELLRAAFAMNTDHLALLVAGTISPATK